VTQFIFSIDVEEWFMAENVRPYVMHDKCGHSSIEALEAILDILECRQIKSTLFVVGELLKQKRYVATLRQAVSNGHEIASHSMTHKLFNDLSAEQTFREVADSIAIINDKLGVAVKGFRSPCFSANEYLEKVLLDNDIVYTSNGIRASVHDRYSNATTFKNILDIPIPYFSLFHLNFPATGGGWFRILPLWVQSLLLTRREFFMFYCHPWDFDVNQPSLSKVPLAKKIRHKINVKNSKAKLNKLISHDFEFLTAAEFIEKKAFPTLL